MSIFEGSRYANAVITLLDGKTTIDPRSRPTFDQFIFDRYSVREHDRPDLMAHRFMHDPSAWWLIADANEPLYPVPEVGKNIRIPK